MPVAGDARLVARYGEMEDCDVGFLANAVVDLCRYPFLGGPEASNQGCAIFTPWEEAMSCSLHPYQTVIGCGEKGVKM